MSGISDADLRHVKLAEIRADNMVGDASALDVSWLLGEVERLAATLGWYAETKNYTKRAEGSFAVLVIADGGARARLGLRVAR